MTTVWITKYALTTGMTCEKDCEIKEVSAGCFYATRSRYGREDYVFQPMGRTAFLTEEEAKQQVCKLARAKLKAIDKQRKKLEELLQASST